MHKVRNATQPTYRHNAVCAAGHAAAHRRERGAEARRTEEVWLCGTWQYGSSKKRDGGYVPEIEHLDVCHPPKHADEEPRMFHPRADEGELAEAGQALQRARVFDEVVV